MFFTYIFILSNYANATLTDKDERFFTAVKNGNLAGVQDSLAEGANINALDHGGKQTALWYASYYCKTDIVKYLLENGVADVNNIKTANNEGTTVYIASKKGCTEIVKLLLDKGADANAKASYNMSALFEATIGGHTEIVKLLLDKGADVNVRTTGTDWTPLMAACQNERGNVDIVKLLLAKGANINARNIRNNSTPLIYASARGHVDIVKVLLDKNADVNVRTSDGKTALSEAKRWSVPQKIVSGGYIIETDNKNYKEIVKLLLEKGAVE